MPARSKAQQRLMAAAEHGADFPMAKKVRASMSHNQLHDFAVGSMKGKPAHVATHASGLRRPAVRTDSHPNLRYKHSSVGSHPGMRYR